MWLLGRGHVWLPGGAWLLWGVHGCQGGAWLLGGEHAWLWGDMCRIQ